MFVQLFVDAANGGFQLLFARDEVLGRVDLHDVPLGQHLAGERVDFENTLHLVAEEGDAEGQLLVGREDVQGVATDAKAAPGEVHVIAVVLHRDEPLHQQAEAAPLAACHCGDEAHVLLGVAKAVDA